MKGGKDEGKPMDSPLFPRLHISDGDKGGPRAPPRNKMALSEQYNVASQGSKLGSVSVPLLPLLPSNGCISFPSQASSGNVGGDKGKVLPLSSGIPGSSHLTERYYSHCHDGAISNAVLTKPEPWMARSENYQTSRVSDDLIMKAKCNLAQPTGQPSYSDLYTQIPGDENSFKAPYFLQSAKGLNYGKIQLHQVSDRGPVSSGEVHNVLLKLPKVMSGDQVSEHCRNAAEENDKLLQDSENCCEKPCRISFVGAKNLSDISLSGDKFSELGIREFQLNQLKKISLGDEQTTIHQECKVLQKCRIFADVKSGIPKTGSRKRCASAMDDSSCYNERTNVDLSKECLKDTYQIGNADKKNDISDNSTDASARDLGLASEDVISVMGHKLFLKARKIIVHQQGVFSSQIFELHRLIKVQRLIARSPEMLHESHFHLNKSSIQFPPINKLLFVTPLDPLPAVSKTKADALKSDTDKDCCPEAVSAMLPLPASDAEKGQQITTKPLLPMLPSIGTDAKLAPLPLPASIPADAKLAPWCFQPPPGSQWLVPTRFPSEGLVYKSYTGPCFPTADLMAPVYGNCGPMSLSTVGGMAYGVPLGQNYFQSYGAPNANGLNLEAEQMNSSTRNANIGIPSETLAKVLSEQSTALSDLGRKIDGQGSSPNSPERTDRETLALFPTTPSCQVQNDQSKVQAIKVVPHNHKSAAESAARIFESIQEERKRA